MNRRTFSTAASHDSSPSRVTRSAWLVALSVATFTACGGSQPPPAREPPTAQAPPPDAHKPALRMKSELGDIDLDAVKRAFHALNDKFMDCAKREMDRVEVLSGNVKFFVRIAEDGSAKWAYLEDSEIGDRAVEKCLIQTVLGAQYPRPDGGEAEARYGIELPLQSTRPPNEWGAEKVSQALAKHADAIGRCKAGTSSGLQATMYVGPGGRVLAAGISGAGKGGDEEADCLVQVLEKMKGLPSPGSWPAKVRFAL
jgi:hypothetical protein